MAKPYMYVLEETTTGRLYIGCQYNRNADPADLGNRYLTSCKYVQKNYSNFVVRLIREHPRAAILERRYLSQLYRKLGRDAFLEKYINRNLAPGIIHDETERKSISERMKALWQTPERQEQHRQMIKRRKESGSYDKRKGIDPFSDEVKASISERMTKYNPMSDPEARARQLAAVSTDEHKRALAARKKGNKNTQGRTWYNNGITTKMSTEPPGPEWVPGRLQPHWNTNRKRNGTQER